MDFSLNIYNAYKTVLFLIRIYSTFHFKFHDITIYSIDIKYLLHNISINKLLVD